MSNEDVVIVPYRDGPYLIRGPALLRDQEGESIEAGRRTIALCRCGKSRLRPFCDGTHRLVRFQAPSAAETRRPKNAPQVEASPPVPPVAAPALDGELAAAPALDGELAAAPALDGELAAAPALDGELAAGPGELRAMASRLETLRRRDPRARDALADVIARLDVVAAALEGDR